MSGWTKFVTAYYKKKRVGNASYKFKNALKDAAKVYKSSGKTEKVAPKGKSRKAHKYHGTRKNRK